MNNTYERLSRLLENEKQREIDRVSSFIQNGYMPTWNEKEKSGDPDRGILQYATPYLLDRYARGEISREQIVLKATARGSKAVDKRFAECFDLLTSVADTSPATTISIHVEWKKSQTWGWNPTAIVTAGTSRTTARASGCGYDKGSAAISKALSDSKPILRRLYDYAERELARGVSIQHLANNPAIIAWGDIFGYGAGYGLLPSFEGGVGFDTTAAILKRIGFDETVYDRSSQTHDYYNYAYKYK